MSLIIFSRFAQQQVDGTLMFQLSLADEVIIDEPVEKSLQIIKQG